MTEHSQYYLEIKYSENQCEEATEYNVLFVNKITNPAM